MKNLEDIYPLTPMQEAMLLHAVGNPDSTELNSHIVFELPDECHVSQLEIVWAKLIDRHSVLRTGFHWKSEQGPLQFVLGSAVLESEVVELKSGSSESVELQKARILSADKQKPIDITKAPLMRVMYIISDTGEKTMLWTSHHLILDRWCIPIIVSELESLLSELLAQELPVKSSSTSSFSSVKTQPQPFKSYISFIQSSSPNAALNYWVDYLDGFRGGESLTMRNRVATATGEQQATVHVSFSELGNFNQLKRRTGATSAALFQVAWGLTMSRLVQNPDVLFGVTVSGRPAGIPGIERMIGCFINNVASRCNIEPEVSLNNLLSNLLSDQQSREPHQHFSLLQLNQAFKAQNKSTQDRLIDTLFLWLNKVESAAEVPSQANAHTRKPLKPIGDGHQAASVFPLSMIVNESVDGFDLILKTIAGFTTITPLDDMLTQYRATLQMLGKVDINEAISQLPGFEFIAQSGVQADSDDVTHVDSDVVSWQAATQSPVSSGESLSGREKGRDLLEKTYVEQVLLHEWKVALKLCELDKSLSFFELGGNSIDAARLHNRVETMLRCSIPIITLYSKPHFNDMLDIIVDNSWTMKPDVCLPIRATGSLQPLFCVATPDVNTIGFAHLGNRLSDTIPVFVLQAPPESSTFRELLPGELPPLAEQYVKAMQEVQPEGPYHLFGMCTGAQLTYEMAKILENKGESCGLVGILNTWATFTVSRTYRLQQLMSRYKLLTQERWLDVPMVLWRRVIVRRVLQPLFTNRNHLFATSTASESSASSPSKSVLAESETPNGPGPASESAAPSGQPTIPQVDEWVHVYGWHRLYKPAKKLKQKLTVYAIEQQPFWRIRSQHLGWELHAESVETKKLKCDAHENLFREPSITDIVEVLEKSLLRK